MASVQHWNYSYNKEPAETDNHPKVWSQMEIIKKWVYMWKQFDCRKRVNAFKVWHELYKRIKEHDRPWKIVRGSIATVVTILLEYNEGSTSNNVVC